MHGLRRCKVKAKMVLMQQDQPLLCPVPSKLIKVSLDTAPARPGRWQPYAASTRLVCTTKLEFKCQSRNLADVVGRPLRCVLRTTLQCRSRRKMKWSASAIALMKIAELHGPSSVVKQAQDAVEDLCMFAVPNIFRICSACLDNQP